MRSNIRSRLGGENGYQRLRGKNVPGKITHWGRRVYRGWIVKPKKGSGNGTRTRSASQKLKRAKQDEEFHALKQKSKLGSWDKQRDSVVVGTHRGKRWKARDAGAGEIREKKTSSPPNLTKGNRPTAV